MHTLKQHNAHFTNQRNKAKEQKLRNKKNVLLFQYLDEIAERKLHEELSNVCPKCHIVRNLKRECSFCNYDKSKE